MDETRVAPVVRTGAETVFALLALASLAAASIHFAVTPEHFGEYAPYGIFFSIVGWLQALWAFAVIVGPTRRVLGFGLIMNASLIGLWVVSRTVGLPLGPEPGMPEAIGAADVVCGLVESAMVVTVTALLVRPRIGTRATRAAPQIITSVALLLIVATTIAVAR